MANADASEFRFEMRGFDPSPNADTEAHSNGPAKTRRLIKERFIQGAGDKQMTVLFAQDSDDSGTPEIGTSATVSIDLKTALDSHDVALALTDTLLVFIEHKADSLASSISAKANAADGFTNLMNSTALAVNIPPGSIRAFYDPVADAMVVAADNKIIDLVNADGANTAGYRIEVWGRI
jgi:hypothetical protein